MSNLVFSRQIDQFHAHLMLAISYGTAWSPKQNHLTIAHLQQRLDYWRAMHLTISKHNTAIQQLRNSRVSKMKEGIFNAKRIRWNLELALHQDDPRRMQIITLFKEMHNNRPAKPVTPMEPKSKRSLSKRAFTDRIDQFIRLSAILDGTPEYIPEEEELSAENWKQLVLDLIELRESCQNADIKEEQYRILLENGKKELSKFIHEINRYAMIRQLKHKVQLAG